MENKVDITLITISLSCVLLLTIAWNVGGVYKKPYLNILNSTSILNLVVLSTAIRYIVKYTKLTRHTNWELCINELTVPLLLLLGSGSCDLACPIIAPNICKD